MIIKYIFLANAIINLVNDKSYICIIKIILKKK